MRLLAAAFVGLLPLLVLSANLGHTSATTVQAVHAKHGHTWNVRWHGPAQHLHVLRAIKQHDEWVVGNAQRFHFAANLTAFHRREWRHAMRKILWAKANLRPTSIPQIICSIFTGPLCSQALRIVRCESEFQVNAQSGDYLGLWQFGSYARSTYGFAWDAWSQTRAAYRMYRAEGWRPWQCAYLTGVL